MTDEERKQLITSLRDYQGYDKELTKMVRNAADEIERLVEMTGRYKILSKSLCTVIRQKITELEGRLENIG